MKQWIIKARGMCYTFLARFSIGFIIFSFLSIVLIDKSVKYTKQNFVLISNIFLLIFAFICLYLISKWITHPKVYKHFYMYIFIIHMLLFLLQIVITLQIQFKVGWDVHVLLENAKLLANKENINSIYFSIYPNNLFLLYIFSKLYMFGQILSLPEPMLVILIFNNLCISLSAILTINVIRKFVANHKIIIIIDCLLIPLIVLSPWMVVPYSDAVGILFPILIINIYYSNIKHLSIKTGLIGFISIIGFSIKPTVVIVLIALFICFVLKMRLSKLKRYLFPFITICIGISIAFGMKSMMVHTIKYDQDKNLEMPMTHFMMMGMNPETLGSYNRSDYFYSLSFETNQSRIKGNIEEIKYRLNHYGIKGYSLLLMKKNLSDYNDGTFSWENEGRFDLDAHKNYNKNIFTSIYYKGGKYFQYYVDVIQFIWIFTLLLGCFACFNQINKYALFALSLFGISLFLLLFECRARYLFLYSPFFIVLASLGLQAIEQADSE